MPTVDVMDLENRKVGTLELSEAVFAAPENEPLVHQAVVAHLAGLRAGTHKAKRRGEVRGSGRKLWRQKGTGRARVGSRRSPIWRGGGVTHGPRPRSHAQRLPRKMVLAALRSALSAKLAARSLTVVRDFGLPTHKTREFRAALNVLGARGTVLVVSNEANRNLELSSRNLPGVQLASSAELHPYSVLRSERIVMSAQAARNCSEVLA